MSPPCGNHVTQMGARVKGADRLCKAKMHTTDVQRAPASDTLELISAARVGPIYSPMTPLSKVQNIHTSQIYLPMDDTSASTTPTPTDEEHRWSDVVPPKAALTFAALWDPDEGMITFSGARLLESDSNLSIAPHSGVYGDAASQVTSYDRGIDPAVEDVTPLSTLHDAFRTFLYRVPSRSLRYREPRSPLTRTSSALETKGTHRREVPLRSSRSLQIPRAHRGELSTPQSVRTSPMSAMFRSHTDRIPEVCAVKEQSITGKHGYLASRFSTTTSTSTYVDVARTPRRRAPPPALGLRTPKDEGLTSPSSPSQSPLATPRRRLRKRRPGSEGHTTTVGTRTKLELPKTTSDGRNPFSLLSRSPSKRTLSSPATLSKSGSIKYKFPNFPRRMASRRSNASDEGWVYIEVLTSIQQLYVPDPGED